METLSTRQVGQRIRRGTLPEYSNGYVQCACHLKVLGATEGLRFWSKGDMVMCGDGFVPALAVFPVLGITIDTRR